MARICSTLLLAACAAAGIVSSSAVADVTARQKEVAQRGHEVMPFSLAATTHIFTRTADGGIQQVVTKRSNPEQAALIRRHLAMIAQQFAAGDFKGPESIHGKNMPGLAALRAAKPGELKVRYRDLPNGGEIAYQTAQPRLVVALRQWFDAQLSDHSHDAMRYDSRACEQWDGGRVMSASITIRSPAYPVWSPRHLLPGCPTHGRRDCAALRSLARTTRTRTYIESSCSAANDACTHRGRSLGRRKNIPRVVVMPEENNREYAPRRTDL